MSRERTDDAIEAIRIHSEPPLVQVYAGTHVPG
jgi:hypothetical protein